jgi:hypothetical protein
MPISVNNMRASVHLDWFFQNLSTPVGIHAIGDASIENISTMKIQKGRQVKEIFRLWNVGYISIANLVWSNSLGSFTKVYSGFKCFFISTKTSEGEQVEIHIHRNSKLITQRKICTANQSKLLRTF